MKRIHHLTDGALRLIILACTAFASGAGGAAAQDERAPSVEERAEAAFKAGRDALFRRDIETAVEELVRAVTLDESKTSYKLNLATAQRYANRLDESERLLREILLTTPDHIEAGLALGELLFSQSKHEAVVATLEPLLEYRHDYLIHRLLARSSYELGAMKKARKYFEEAIRLNADGAEDHYRLADIYLASNLFALAAESFNRCASLGLGSPVLHYKLASTYFSLRNYFGAVAEITVPSGEPGTIEGEWFLIEAVSGQRDRFRAAPAASSIYRLVQAIAQGLEVTPEVEFLEATIYLNGGRFRRAHERFTAIQDKVSETDRPLLFYYYAQSAFGIGDYEEYLRLLQEAIKLDRENYAPALVDAYLEVADQKNSLGDLEGYTAYLHKALGEAPTTASLHLKLGDAYEEAERFPDAIVHWKMVLDLEPRHADRIALRNKIARIELKVARAAKDAKD